MFDGRLGDGFRPQPWSTLSTQAHSGSVRQASPSSSPSPPPPQNTEYSGCRCATYCSVPCTLGCRASDPRRVQHGAWGRSKDSAEAPMTTNVSVGFFVSSALLPHRGACKEEPAAGGRRLFLTKSWDPDGGPCLHNKPCRRLSTKTSLPWGGPPPTLSAPRPPFLLYYVCKFPVVHL